ncbi:MAG: hypothetical protein VXZ00_03595 [Pseudomonadota bacterium]|nr:hypothetical protein [Pseudomonadota bacterium]
MFAKVTETNGVVHWINLNHVRELIVMDGNQGQPTLTEVSIDNQFVAKVFRVRETPEMILTQARD